MIKMVARRLALIVLLLPLLSFAGFKYAVAHPRFNSYSGQSLLASQRYQGLVLPSYRDYIEGVVRGDWGEFRGVPVPEIIRTPLLNSLVLLALSLASSALLGPAIGVWSVSRRTRRVRPAALILSTLVLSMPGFFLGVVIIGIVIYGTLTGNITRLPIPLSGFGLDAHLILPVVVLSSRPTFQIARLTSDLLEHELQQDYIQVARSKGLAWRRLFWQHAFPNVVSAIVVAVGQSTRLLISGLIIVETLFLWPGVGRLFMLDIGIRTDGRASFDFFAHPELLSALAVVFGALLLLADLAAAIIAHLLDPRQNRPLGQATPASPREGQ